MQVQRTFTELSDDIKLEFLKLSTKLSPENLSCDGELTRAETDAAYQTIMRQWRALEKAHDTSVCDEEVMCWHSEQCRSRRSALLI